MRKPQVPSFDILVSTRVILGLCWVFLGCKDHLLLVRYKTEPCLLDITTFIPRLEDEPGRDRTEKCSQHAAGHAVIYTLVHHIQRIQDCRIEVLTSSRGSLQPRRRHNNMISTQWAIHGCLGFDGFSLWRTERPNPISLLESEITLYRLCIVAAFKSLTAPSDCSM